MEKDTLHVDFSNFLERNGIARGWNDTIARERQALFYALNPYHADLTRWAENAAAEKLEAAAAGRYHGREAYAKAAIAELERRAR
jgi:hypothetical protein